MTPARPFLSARMSLRTAGLFSVLITLKVTFGLLNPVTIFSGECKSVSLIKSLRIEGLVLSAKIPDVIRFLLTEEMNVSQFSRLWGIPQRLSIAVIEISVPFNAVRVSGSLSCLVVE